MNTKATNTSLFGLILAGGYSRRMGQDKALLDFHGRPQIKYVYDLLDKYCSKVFLSKRPEQQTYPGVAAVNDDPVFAGHGPLSGILSAMKAYPGISWLVLACDLPFVTEQTLQQLLERREVQKVATAFMSAYDNLPEPLCTIWEAHAYQAIVDLFEQGIHCPRKVLIKSNVVLIKQANPRWLDNVNTGVEYEQAKQTLLGLEVEQPPQV